MVGKSEMNAGEDVAFFLIDHPGRTWVTDAPWGDERTERKPEPPAVFQYTHRDSSMWTTSSGSWTLVTSAL